MVVAPPETPQPEAKYVALQRVEVPQKGSFQAIEEMNMQSTAHAKQDNVKDAANDVSADFETLKADVTRLSDSVRKLASDQLGTSVEDLQAKAGEQITAAERAIRKNPTQAALIAAGVGFLVGLIMIR